MKKLDPPNPEAYKRLYIQQFDASFSQRASILITQAKSWCILFNTRIQSINTTTTTITSSSTEDLYELYGNILLKGMVLTKQISYLAQSCLVMHTTMQVREWVLLLMSAFLSGFYW